MRTIERSSAFKRDYQRAKATPRHSKDVDSLVSIVVALLVSDQVLPKNNRDDEEWQALTVEPGPANRGVRIPLGKDNPVPLLDKAPDYVKECLVVDGRRAFDHLIYLHGSTCSNEVGLTMTFAHELQHFVQYGKTSGLWAANALVPNLPRSVIEDLGLTWCDVPHEREARIVSKRTAENLFGAEVVRLYVDAKIAARVTKKDATDWECIRGLVTATPYDLARETGLFFPRLKRYREELEGVLRRFQNDADFKDVDLHTLLDGPRA